jgi:signal transduction histidine kinase
VTSVTDNGFGIPEAQQAMMFTKFFRADNARVKHTDGTGLGLYIIKSILEHSGGSIWYSSEENKGSIFYLAIPMTGMRAKVGNTEIVDRPN